MFSVLLDTIDSICPESGMLPPEQHKILIDETLPSLMIDSDPILGAAKAIFGEAYFDTSTIGFEHSHIKEQGENHIGVAFGGMYIRAAQNKRALSLELNLLRAYKSRATRNPSCVAIDLEFAGLPEKQAFEVLYSDYRAKTIQLLEYGQIEFSTCYCSDIVGKTKSRKIAAKLDEYFSDPAVDNAFTLTKLCPRGTSHSTVIRSFLTLSVLYAACRAATSGKGAHSTFERNVQRLL